MIDQCEVRDYVLSPDGTLTLRMINEAGNAELVRRGGAPLAPSGEVAPDAIAWVNTCGGVVVEPGV